MPAFSHQARISSSVARLRARSAMSDPSVNRTTANQLYQLHDQLMQAEKAMLQVVLDGLLV